MRQDSSFGTISFFSILGKTKKDVMQVSLTRVRNIVKISTCVKFEIVWLVVVIKKLIGEIPVVEKEKRELFEISIQNQMCIEFYWWILRLGCGGHHSEFLRNLERQNTIQIRTTEGLFFGENFPLFQNCTCLKLRAIMRGPWHVSQREAIIQRLDLRFSIFRRKENARLRNFWYPCMTQSINSVAILRTRKSILLYEKVEYPHRVA